MSTPDITQPTETYQVPLTFSQKALWFIDQMNPGIRAYDLTNGVRIRGALNTDALAEAVNLVFARHEALRSRIEERDNDYWLVIAPVAQSPYTQAQVADEAAASADLEQYVQQPFELVAGKLFRARLVSWQEGDQAMAYFVVRFHHIIVDQASIEIVIQEIGTAYNAIASGRKPDLPEKQIDFADYAIWQHDEISKEGLADGMAFWRDHIKGQIGCIDLPTDRPRAPIQSFSGDEFRRPLADGLTAKVQGYSKSERVSVFATLLSAYAVMLSRYARQEKVIIGVPFANRAADEGLDEVVGLFINTLPIPVQISPDSSFSDLVTQTSVLMRKAKVAEATPLEYLFEELSIARDTSYNPLYQTGFSFQPPPAVPSLSNLQVEDLGLHPHAAPYDLQTWIHDTGENQFGIQIWFDDALYDPETINHMVETFETVLGAGIAQPGARLKDLPSSRSAASSGAVVAETHEHQPVERSTYPALLQSRTRVEDAAQLVCGAQKCSYESMLGRANAISANLIEQGLRSGDRVGILLDRDLALIPSLIGALQIGVAYVPLDPNYPRDLLAFVIEDADLSGIITSSNHVESLESLFAKPLCMADDLGPELPEPPVVSFDPETVAYIIYTSGSTGRPKGVEISHRSMSNLLWSMLDVPGLKTGDVLVAVTTTSFDISVFELLAPVLVGATTVLASYEESRDIRSLAKLVESSQASIMQATPSTWRMLVEQAFQPAPGFRAITGGEPLAPDLAKGLLSRVAELWNGYGPTEGTIYATMFKVTDPDTIRIGLPILNTKAFILDAFGNDVPPGAPGELYLGGTGVAIGYLDRPELTAERFIEHPYLPGERIYQTGDLVRVRNDGAIDHLGRLDHQIKIRGFRVELGQIESVMNDHDAVAESVAHAQVLDANDQRLIVYAVVDQAASINDLRRYLRSQLADYMVPQFIVALDELPRMPNGKIDRNALPPPQGMESKAFAAPQGDTEVAVAEIWARLIGVEQIGRDENFFSAGGHSMLAMRALAEMESGLKLKVGLQALVSKSLAELCTEARASIDQSQPVVPRNQPKFGLFARLKSSFGKAG